MTVELLCLFGSVLILAIMLAIQGALVPATQGFAYGLGPRDEQPPPNVLQGRLNRAIANHMEGLAVFAPLAVITKLIALSTPVTQLGAMLYLAGRAAFPFFYAFGVPGLRSLVWGVSAAGIVLVGYEVARAAL